MTEKRFRYYEHKGADYILDNPNTELDFIEMLGDALSSEEIVDLLNFQDSLVLSQYKELIKIVKENEQLKKDLKLFTNLAKDYNLTHEQLYEITSEAIEKR